MSGRRHLQSGSTFERDYGYARAVVDGRWVFVAGTTGYDYASMTISPDVTEQCRQALANIETALVQAGARLHDTVRVTYYLKDRNDFPACASLLKATFGASPPAATMIVCDMIDADVKIEIEVTALTPGDH